MTIDWRKRVEDNRIKILSENVDVINIDQAKSKRYLSLEIFIEKNISEQMLATTRGGLPKSIVNKIYWQSADSLHLTLQASEFGIGSKTEDDYETLSNKINEYFRTINSIMCRYIYPICNKSGIIGVCSQTEEICKLRKEVTKIWTESGLQTVVEESYYNFPYSLLGRFTDKLNPEETEAILSVPEISTETILSEIKLCISDKFATPETSKIIRSYQLN